MNMQSNTVHVLSFKAMGMQNSRWDFESLGIAFHVQFSEKLPKINVLTHSYLEFWIMQYDYRYENMTKIIADMDEQNLCKTLI